MISPPSIKFSFIHKVIRDVLAIQPQISPRRPTLIFSQEDVAEKVWYISTYILNVCPCCREESAASESTEPVQLFWKADRKSIHLIDDGNSTKNFSFGMFRSMNRIYKCFYWVLWILLRYFVSSYRNRNLQYLHFVPLMFTDRVFTAEETTNQLYQDIAKPLVVSTVEGYNGM